MIRQQLTNSEDIRHVRKKAPCSQSEISLIQKQYLEDESFLEPLFTGEFVLLPASVNLNYPEFIAVSDFYI